MLQAHEFKQRAILRAGCLENRQCPLKLASHFAVNSRTGALIAYDKETHRVLEFPADSRVNLNGTAQMRVRSDPAPAQYLKQIGETGDPYLATNTEGIVYLTMEIDGVGPKMYFGPGRIIKFSESGRAWTIFYEAPGKSSALVDMHRPKGVFVELSSGSVLVCSNTWGNNGRVSYLRDGPPIVSTERPQAVRMFDADRRPGYWQGDIEVDGPENKVNVQGYVLLPGSSPSSPLFSTVAEGLAQIHYVRGSSGKNSILPTWKPPKGSAALLAYAYTDQDCCFGPAVNWQDDFDTRPNTLVTLGVTASDTHLGIWTDILQPNGILEATG
eukprot:TRINITY_DN12213_c0_g1_i5.p1 TRINITY_DN12213_c0_g1~~TRINITY_DN12213_c0_g1_i5.p1  ORF type:complete len:363 (-),score=45.66 TRINITY_DN12213_c0_g1_i5:38-1018(-)